MPGIEQMLINTTVTIIGNFGAVFGNGSAFIKNWLAMIKWLLFIEWLFLYMQNGFYIIG